MTGAGKRIVEYLTFHDLRQSYLPFPITLKENIGIAPAVNTWEVCLNTAIFEQQIRSHISALNLGSESEEIAMRLIFANLFNSDFCSNYYNDASVTRVVQSWGMWSTANKEAILRKSKNRQVFIETPRNSAIKIVPIELVKLPLVIQLIIQNCYMSTSTTRSQIRFPNLAIIPNIRLIENESMTYVNDGYGGNVLTRLRLTKDGGKDPTPLVVIGTATFEGPIDYFSVDVDLLKFSNYNSNGQLNYC